MKSRQSVISFRACVASAGHFNWLRCGFVAGLLLAFAGTVFSQADDAVFADPTRPNPTTAGALEALRRANGAGAEQRDANTDIEYSLSGLVMGGYGDVQQGMVIIRIADTFALAGEGQTIRTGNDNLTIVQINGESVQIKDNITGETHVLRANALALPDEEGTLPLVEFHGVPLSLAMQALSFVTNQHIAVSTEARDIPVTLFLRNVTAQEALNTLVATHQLYSGNINGSDILRLQTIEEFARGSATYQEEQNRVFTLRFPNARDIALTIRDLFGERVRLSERIDEGEESGEFLTENLEQRLERFDIIAGRSQGLGFDQGGGQGQSSNNIGLSRLSSLSDNRSQNERNFNQGSRNRDSFLLTDEEIRQLGAMDAARIEAIRDARADIFVSVIDRLNRLLVRTRDERTMDEIAMLVEALDRPAQLVFLEIRILSVQLDDGLDTAFNWSFTSGDWTGSFSPGNPTVNGNLVFSYLSDTFRADLQLLQDRDKLTVLGQPSLMTANNEVSRIFIGQQVPILTGFGDSTTVVTDLGNTINFNNPEYEDQDVGSTLLITPNINDDSTIEIRLLQEESQIVRNGANLLVPDGVGGFDERTIDIVAAQTVSGTFIAANNRTFAIGGLIQESIEDQTSQIPVLGDIPYLGRLFRNQATSRRRDEIIILITPRIINNGAEGQRISNEYVQERSLHPNRDFDSGNLDVFEESEVLVPGVPNENDPLDTVDALFRDRYGPRK